MSPKINGSYTNIFDMDAGRLGVAIAASWYDREFGSDNWETGGAWTELEDGNGAPFWGLEEFEQRNYDITRERTGVGVNLDFQTNGGSEYYLRSLWSDFSDQEYRTRETHVLEEGDAVVLGSENVRFTGAELEREMKDRYETQEILSIKVGGMNRLGDLTIDYSGAYSHAEETEPDRLDTNFVIEDVTLGYSSIGEVPRALFDARTLSPAAYEMDEIEYNDNITEDDETSLAANVQYDFGGNLNGFVKGGFLYREREKVNNATVVVYEGFPGDPTLEDFAILPPDYGLNPFGPGVDAGQLRAFFNQNRANFDIDDEATLVDSTAGDYTMNEDVTALYGMARLDFNAWRVVFGARWEDTDFSAQGQRIIVDEVAGTGDPTPTPVSFSQNYDNILPSINVRFAPTDTLVFRAAASQTIARPNIGQLSPGGEIEFTTNDDGENELEAEIGNPLLEPTESTNFDATVEWYPGGLGVLSAGVFYKDLDAFIVTADVGETIDLTQFVGNTPVDDAEVIQPINGDSAEVLGFEVTYSQAFTMLPAPLDGLLINANATFTDAEAELGSRTIDLPRQSDLVWNLALGYETNRVSLRLAGTFRDKSLLEVGDIDDPLQDAYQDEHMQLDFSAKWNVTPNVQLFFNALNLIDEPFYVYQFNRAYNFQYEEYGLSYSLGVTYRNF